MKADKANEASFLVRVTPRARRTQFTGRMQAGSNTELISYLASVLDVHRSAIEVASGEHSRNKRVSVKGCTMADVESAFKADISTRLP